jgi:hypothetical protein
MEFRKTSKYKNLKEKAQVSIFIDNRSNQEADFLDAIGMTVLGDARELNDAARKKSMGCFIRKHPSLEEFLGSPDCALFMIKVRVYYVVWHFHQVTEVRL